jgi:hypothetical protein
MIAIGNWVLPTPLGRGDELDFVAAQEGGDVAHFPLARDEGSQWARR